MQPETRLVNSIKKTLASKGGFWIKIHGGAFQVSGLPDIIGCYKGRFIGLEVKLPDRVRVSPRQRLMLKRIRHSGGITAVLTSTRGALEVIQKIDSQLD